MGLEARRTALQTVAEIDRGLQLAQLELRQGRMGSARETLGQVRALLVLQEGLIRALLAENRRNANIVV